VPHFGVTSHREAGSLVVATTGELDIAAVQTVREEIARREPGERLTIDLRGLSFLDTSGIQLVVEAFRAARDDGFELTVLRGPERVQRVFEIAGLDSVLPFADA
jgi:anti-sigma B factor antagonist